MPALDFADGARLAGGPGTRRKSFLLGALALSFACVALDNTKLVLAVPTLARELGGVRGGTALVRWIVEANLVVYASLLLAGGALAERFGPRRLLLGGAALFLLGSLAAALAPSAAELLVARALLGVGTAAMTPASLAAIKHGFSPPKRPRAVAIWTASFAAAGALGPLLGGLLLERWGWRSLLLLNLPPAALAALGVAWLVPHDLPRRRAPLDVLGLVLGLGTSVCLLLALLGGVSPALRALAAVVGVATLAALCAWQRRARHPMLDPQLFRLAPFRLGLGVILLGYLAFAGLSFAVAQHLQLVRGHAPSTASLLNLPLPLGLSLGTLACPALMARRGAERALGASARLALAGALLAGLGCALDSDLVLCAALLPFAAGAGASFATATLLVCGVVPAERAGSAAAISETAFELGGVLGIALLGAPLLSREAGTGASASAAGAAVAWAVAVLLAERLLRTLRRAERAAPWSAARDLQLATEPSARVCR